MGIGAIVLGVFAFVCMIGGVVLSWVPFLGTMLSFLAPVLALAGIILGGVALSRAKAGGGESEGLAIGGLVTSVVALIPAMIVALTCGVCNICATGMYLDPDFGRIDGGRGDAGVLSNGAISPGPSPPPPFPTAAPPVYPSAPNPPPPFAPPPSTAMMPTTSPGMSPTAPPPAPPSSAPPPSSRTR